jgi:dihydrodipicolinate synthase/N-acetylneuraminate lyase
MKRSDIYETFFGGSAPMLWCPLISHYNEKGGFDEERFAAHIARLSKWVGGFLAPGSTGDGWEMAGSERFELVDLLKELFKKNDRLMLIGVLETERKAAARGAAEIGRRFGGGSLEKLRAQGLCGITVTAPKGFNLSQEVITEELAAVLDAGLPTALYQLPQITENDMEPETVEELARRFPNFYLFKDTGGEDRVAFDAELPEDLFLVRGAEGEYYRWLKKAGGPYNGFLLSTANCFAGELAVLIEAVEAGDADGARKVSDRICRIVTEAFSIVEALPFGNPFANANKGMDHFMAYGGAWNRTPAPKTHSKERLPHDIMDSLAGLLESEGLLPRRGYLEG